MDKPSADPVDNRLLILEVATRLFSERGYEGVGVSELCEASGVTKPTLYHYFGSKRGLLDAVIAERGGPFLASVREAARYDRDVKNGLTRVASAFARHAESDPLFARLRLSLGVAPPESESGAAALAFSLGLREALEVFFREAARDHGNMKGRSRPFAATFIATLDCYVGLHLSGQGDLGEVTLREALRQFMHGIFS